ncbi:MAG: hypothetical protein ACN6O7_04955 [Sphingobacterium sp.]
MRINFYILTLLIFFSSCGTTISKTNVSWFYPWETNPNQLLPDNFGFIPVNKNGTSYRIVRIDNFSGSIITSLLITSKNVDISVSELPIFKNYSGKNMIDVILPVKDNYKLESSIPNQSRYFLVKLKGKATGKQDFSITIQTNNAAYLLKYTAAVGSYQYNRNVNLNTWSYFDYNFMLQGAKISMINALQSLNANVLVIPPYILPDINNISKPNTLLKYLRGSEGKFKYYILYFGGFQSKSNDLCSPNWYANYTRWIKNITREMNALGIRQDQILLYPIDEPKGDNVNKLNRIIAFSKENGIVNNFFSTAENDSALESMSKIRFGQLHTGQEKLASSKIRMRASSKNDTWIYETRFGSSREQSPVNYLRLGWKASLLGVSGIGIWNFCDVKQAYSLGQQNQISQGSASWNIIPQNPSYDNTIIYRRGDSLYSSLRGLALSSGLEEVFWLDLYRKSNGQKAAEILINNLISGKLNYSDMEVVKCKLIN